MEFVFSKKAKTISYVMMAIGVIALLVGGITDHSEHHGRFWSNILIDSFFFLAIGLGAIFFYALQYATETGWSALVKRVFEGIFSTIPVFIGILLLVLLVGSFHGHHLYHWMDPEVHNPESEHFDAIIANKSAYLNLPFFWLRALIYSGVFIFFARKFRQKSLLEDQVGGTEIHTWLYKRSALFLVFFAVFSSTLAWDWIMSIDTHWFSTLFGWYVFSGMWCSAMITAVILVRYLKLKGYLEFVNDNHIHDLGKWTFALSFLWTYLWFSQFMLIWYSDIPEEVTYFVERIEHFKIPYFIMFFTNFILPMVLLMGRGAKRNPKLLISVAVIIFIGHWFDVYFLITPGAIHHFNLGFLEIGGFIGFAGLFIYLVFRAFTKAPFLAKNHPFIDESKHMHI